METEDEMAGVHPLCNGQGLGQTPGDHEGQGDLICCSPWGLKESDTTGQLSNSSTGELMKPERERAVEARHHG